MHVHYIKQCLEHRRTCHSEHDKPSLVPSYHPLPFAFQCMQLLLLPVRANVCFPSSKKSTLGFGGGKMAVR